MLKNPDAFLSSSLVSRTVTIHQNPGNGKGGISRPSQLKTLKHPRIRFFYGISVFLTGPDLFFGFLFPNPEFGYIPNIHQDRLITKTYGDP
jgi:hypothetical protein